jgi:hypothetical protein
MATRSGVGPRPTWILALLCVPLATASCDWLRDLFGIRTTSRPPPVRTEPQDIRAAMLSVYYHAYGLDLLDPLPEGEPIPLEDAARILAADTSEGATARRRRAIAKLATGEVLRPRAAQLRPALEILVPPRAFDVDDLLALLPREAKLPASWPVPIPMFHEDLRQAFRERITTALAFLDTKLVAAFERRCCSGVKSCTVRPATTSTAEVSAYFVLMVRRDVDSLRANLDPQEWDVCAPDYFQDVHYEAATCPAPNAPAAAAPASNPAEGSGWDGALYEHFQKEFANGKSTWFKNNLQICGDWDPTNELYRYHYGLCTGGSLESSVLGDGPIKGGLDKDCGLLRAWDKDPSNDAPDWTEVDGVKRIRFSPRTPDHGLGLWTNLGLELLVDTMADTVLCCGANDTSACKVVDEQCIQSKSEPLEKWPPTPACDADSSPACSVIESPS